MHMFVCLLNSKDELSILCVPLFNKKTLIKYQFILHCMQSGANGLLLFSTSSTYVFFILSLVVTSDVDKML